MNSEAVLAKYFDGRSLEMVVAHGRAVAGLATDIGRLLALPYRETVFLEQAAMLHDIGICRVFAPDIELLGDHPYIMHGVLGRDILDCEGLWEHALVCERHIGVGLSVKDIVDQGLPLPERDMTPQTLAEEIVCFADLFFSKKPGSLQDRISPDNVRNKLERHGADKIQIFDLWMGRFGAALGPHVVINP